MVIDDTDTDDDGDDDDKATMGERDVGTVERRDTLEKEGAPSQFRFSHGGPYSLQWRFLVLGGGGVYGPRETCESHGFVYEPL